MDMGLDVLMAREDRLPRSACRYQRLRGELGGGEGDDDGRAPSFAAGRFRLRRPLRVRRRRACKAAPGRWRATTSGGNKRLPRLRLVFLLPAARRMAALFVELVRRLAMAASAVDAAAADCPSIVFSSQWGLPVLSHHSASTSGRSARLRALYLERSLSARSGSPC